jgi:hypothetical protein
MVVFFDILSIDELDEDEIGFIWVFELFFEVLELGVHFMDFVGAIGNPLIEILEICLFLFDG